MYKGSLSLTYRTLHFMELFWSFDYSPNSFSMNSRPTRVRFARESERIQIDSHVHSVAQDMYDECFEPISPPRSELENSSTDLAKSLGFDSLPRGPAQSLILKCTNPDQLEVGSCYF